MWHPLAALSQASPGHGKEASRLLCALLRQEVMKHGCCHKEVTQHKLTLAQVSEDDKSKIKVQRDPALSPSCCWWLAILRAPWLATASLHLCLYQHVLVFSVILFFLCHPAWPRVLILIWFFVTLADHLQRRPHARYQVLGLQHMFIGA